MDDKKLQHEPTAKDSPTWEEFYEMRIHAVAQLNDLEKKLDALATSQPEIIKVAIKEHVNGKIDKLTLAVNDYIRLDTERNQRKDGEYAERDEEDKKWKEEFGPYVKGLANLTLGGKILVVIALGISAIIGAVFAVKQLFIK